MTDRYQGVTRGPYALPATRPYSCPQCGSCAMPRHTMREVSGGVTTVYGICNDCDNRGERRIVFGSRRNPAFDPARYPRWNVIAVEVRE